MSDILLPGTAGLPDVLAGKKCTSSAGYMFTGTMTNNGAITITPSSVSQAIPAGFHNGSGNVAAVVVPVANVLAGTTIAGQAGTMVNNGAGGTVTPSTTNQTKAAGFWSSLITILGDANLLGQNISTGKTIFGVAGTAKRQATGTLTTTTATTFDITGLAFNPSAVCWYRVTGAGNPNYEFGITVSANDINNGGGGFKEIDGYNSGSDNLEQVNTPVFGTGQVTGLAVRAGIAVQIRWYAME